MPIVANTDEIVCLNCIIWLSPISLRTLLRSSRLCFPSFFEWIGRITERGVQRGKPPRDLGSKGRRSRVKKKYRITVLWNEVGVFLGKIVVQ